MSSSEGKTWIHDKIAALPQPPQLSVLDIGPGVGTYARLLADLPIGTITGLEVWEPYVATYHLEKLYDRVVIGDVRSAPLPTADVVILGDVVEHMSREEGIAVWRRCAQAAARAVYLSIPVVHYPQDDLEGNPYEVHVEEDWSHDDVLASFDGIGDWQLGDTVGVYERRTDHEATRS